MERPRDNSGLGLIAEDLTEALPEVYRRLFAERDRRNAAELHRCIDVRSSAIFLVRLCGRVL